MNFDHRLFESIADILSQVSESQIVHVTDEICSAPHIAVYGAGREGLVMRGFAMRLYHLGLNVSVVGEMVCQPINPGDCFLASVGPGWLATVEALTTRAVAAGGTGTLVTSEASSVRVWVPEGVNILEIRGRTMSHTPQGERDQVGLPLGSQFEMLLWILCDLLIDRVMKKLPNRALQMTNRHTNLE